MLAQKFKYPEENSIMKHIHDLNLIEANVILI